MPTAVFTFDPPAPVAGRPVQFDASASNGGQSECCSGVIVSYDWSFGDGGTGTTATPTHTYLSAGDFSVSLTVANDFGEQATVTNPVHVVPPPPPFPGAAPAPQSGSVAEVATVSPAIEQGTFIHRHRRGGKALLVRLRAGFAPPAGVQGESACAGDVSFSVRAGQGREKTTSAPLKLSRGRCVASSRLSLAVRGAAGLIHGRVVFAGNADVAAWSVTRKFTSKR